ncbi:MAG: zf-TFIIB domain-containing protein, partial [Deltaproteobacteria bacterium]
MLCPRDRTALRPAQVGPAAVARCPSCRGVWGTQAALEAAIVGAPFVSRAVHVALEGLGHGEALRCPSCTGDLESEEVRQARDHEVLACRACAGLWLDEATCTALRARPAAAPGTSARDRPREGDLPRDEDRPIASEPSRLGAAG